MPGFEDLFHAELGKLNEAVSDWDTQVTKLEGMKDGNDFNAEDLAQQARSAGWSGENAAVTVPYVVDQADQFDAALKQARSLAEICRDAHSRLKGHQDALKSLVNDDAPAAGVHVSTSGEVTADYDGLDGETRRIRSDAVISITADIERILEQANEDDAVVAQALRDAMGTDPNRFNPVSYDSLNEADLAYQDSQTVLRLMAEGEDLSNEQLIYIADLLNRHKNDPAFAERIATELGPQGTLDFWTDVSTSRDIQARDTEEFETMADLQANLGSILGLATRSDSEAMENWEREMIRLGDERQGDNGTGPYGFQTMSALMNTGEYEADFLVDYGDALLTFERADDRPASQLWDTNQFLTLNYTTPDAQEGNVGRDPMTGFLTALGNSPNAATEFFAPPDDFDPAAHVDLTDEESVAENRDRMNDRLAYLATEREWWNSVEHAGLHDTIPVHDSLGDALLAATTGRATDDWNVGDWDPDSGEMPPELANDPRTPETSAVMEQVMQLYGTHDPHLLEEQPEMAESLGLMTAAYIDDIDYVVSMVGDDAPEGADRTFSSPYDGQLDNSRRGTLQFLNAIGQNETSHSIASLGQAMYTRGNLEAFEPVSEPAFEHGERSLRTGAEVHGVLDGARMRAIEAEFGEGSQAAADAEERSTNWMKAGTNALIGVGAGAAAAATAGSGGATAVVVPIAASALGVFVGEFFGQEIDGGDPERDFTEQQQLTGDLHEDTENQLGALAGIYEDDAAAEGIDTGDLHFDTKTSYGNGKYAGDDYDEPNE